MTIPWALDPELDRMPEVRGDAAALSELFPDARFLTVAKDGRVEQRETTGLEFDPLRHVFVGKAAGRHWFAGRGEAEGVSLRDGTLDEAEREVVASACALLHWHDTEPHCDRCHAATAMVPGGMTRECVMCGATAFPRSDPAVIVAVLDSADRLLLAHQQAWPAGRVSILAGFVEAGETIEQAAVREIEEEASLRITALRYLASQPWPFPRSLMLGHVARADGEPVVDGVELGWARWFSREELSAELDAGEVSMPGAGSIAGRIIAAWRAGELTADSV